MLCLERKKMNILKLIKLTINKSEKSVDKSVLGKDKRYLFFNAFLLVPSRIVFDFRLSSIG